MTAGEGGRLTGLFMRIWSGGRSWLRPAFGLIVAVDVGYVAAVLYLCALTLRSSTDRPSPDEFGGPGNAWTILILLALPIAHFALRPLAGRSLAPGTPLLVIAAMAASALVLAMSAYLPCSGAETAFFAPLAWTLNLFLGNVEPSCLDGGMPVALELARLLALATTLTAALSAGMQLFRSQVDKLAILRAPTLSAVVGIDDETVSMVRAILRTQNPAGALVVLTDDIESDAARTVRNLGAKLRAVKLDEPETLAELSLWARVERLYLLSSDPMENLKRFEVIDVAVAKARRRTAPVPLTVRIDDPWQSEIWRRSLLLSTDRRWVADAVGRYEITAAKLVRHITARYPNANSSPPATVLICGFYPLTYALASEFAQVQREQQLVSQSSRKSTCSAPAVVPPTKVVVFAEGAQSFVADHNIRQGRMAPDDEGLCVEAHDAEPAVEAIAEYLEGKDLTTYAVVLGDPSLEVEGTRLASRFPALRVYPASSASMSLVDVSIVGRLYNFPIDMELDPDAPQDVWERAAALIHESWRAGADPDNPANVPFKELDGFRKQSNRRQLLHALWMVEELGGHSWNSLEQTGAVSTLPAGFFEMEPMQQLNILGFNTETVMRMLETEHEDWRRYHLEAGWVYDRLRNDKRRRHDRLQPWAEIGPDAKEAALRSLAGTLINLRCLGYRSVPKAEVHAVSGSSYAADVSWHRFRRRGEVTAEIRESAWTWVSPSGEEMQARAGDWAVVDDEGRERSVAAGVFESTHEEVAPGRYRRSGDVQARRVAEPEVVHTLEGDVLAGEGDWIVRGQKGEQWPVHDAQFRGSYEGPLGADVDADM